MYSHLKIYKIKQDFSSEVKYKQLNIKSTEGLNLFGYFFNKNSNNIALIVHGYGSRAMDMQQYIKLFLDMGYSVLAVDNRGHGKSQGEYISFGKKEQEDISLWVNYLVKKNPNCKIVLFGLSMGATSVSLYSANQKPKNVVAIISDCGFSNGYTIFELVSLKMIVPVFFYGTQFMDIFLKQKVGYKLSDIDVISAVKKCDVPILFLHGSKDNFVPPYMSIEAYNNTPKQFANIHIFKGANHATSLPQHTNEYISVVKKFLDDIKF